MSLHQKALALAEALQQNILGQKNLTDRLMLALFADGHLLVEGAPGLAKTKSIKALANFIEADFHRIQFTPDLLPADITGTDVYRPQGGTFEFQKGPIFHNLILADEVNRAPAKVQSALLEAMGEGQVSVGLRTYPLPRLFLVMATQNPIEQEGTFTLPEAQLDRFMMHVRVPYPDVHTEKAILRQSEQEALTGPKAKSPSSILITEDEIFAIRKEIYSLHMDESVREYIVQLVMATREPHQYHDSLKNLLSYGASPRASIYLNRLSRAVAWLNGRDFVSPSDVQEIAHEVLRHRIGLTFEAESSGISRDQLVDRILEHVALP
jgi:MoxR-like ATPase